MFSQRSSWDLKPNQLAELLAKKRHAGESILDLTNANPTRAGFDYPSDIQAILAQNLVPSYQPDAVGLLAARQAVQSYYADRDITADASQILLTASTSEAYGFLFKLLTDPGDQVLVPQPSYPLFEFLAGLEDVETRSYPLRYDQGWHIDLDRLAAALTPRSRAIILVHPNNPTGSFIKNAERQALEELARECNLALIVDEVFADYAWGEDDERVASFAGAPTDKHRAPLTETPRDKYEPPFADAGVLTFTLSGLSKVMGLPQMKLGWMVVQGPEDIRLEAWQRLEVIADTYLSVATPMQQALPELLPLRDSIQMQIKSRVMENVRLLTEKVRIYEQVAVLDCEGGWYATLAVPTVEEEIWAVELLRQTGVYIHPGYFFDFKREGFVVLSLLTKKEVLGRGLDGLLSLADG